ncbi:MAG: ABC transporter permease, partial [Chloroflexota bacterium]
MLKLALGSIRGRLAAFSGALLAIVFAASLVVACGILIESAIRSDIGGTTRFAEASAIVQASSELTAPARVDEEPDAGATEHPPVPDTLIEELSSVPGVQRAIGDLSFSAQAVDPAGNPLTHESGGPSIGHAWASAALTPFVLQAGEEPVAPDEIVLDSELAQQGGYQVGDSVSVITPEGTQTFTLAGIAAPPGRSGLEEQSAIFFSDDMAETLAPYPEGVSAIGILAEAEIDNDSLRQNLEDALDETRYQVLSGDAKRDVEQFPHQILPSVTTEFLGTASGLTGFVMIFIVANTFSFSVQQRAREIGLLRAVGATPRQVRRMIVNEAAVVAIIGSLIGALLGWVLVWPLRWALIQVKVTSPDMEIIHGPVPIIAAIVSSLIITELAVIAAARRAAKIQPSSALREAAIERRRIGFFRLLFGLLLGGGSLIGFYFVMQVGGEAGAALVTVVVMGLCIGGALLGPILLWPVGWIVGSLLTLAGGAIASLGRANVLANRRRNASVAVPLMLTACFATLFLFIGNIQQHGVSIHTQDRVTSDYIVVSNASSGLPASAADAIQGLPEVTTATGTLSATGVMNTTPIGSEYSDLTQIPVRGIDPEPLASILNLGVTDGTIVD